MVLLPQRLALAAVLASCILSIVDAKRAPAAASGTATASSTSKHHDGPAALPSPAAFKCTWQQHVPAAFVNDTVCDCCDGSDEEAGICANTCSEFSARERSPLLRASTSHKRGADRVRKALVTDSPTALAAKAWFESMLDETESLLDGFDALNAQYEAAKARAAAPGQMTANDMLRMEGMRLRLEKAQDVALRAQARAKLDYGKGSKFLLLASEPCVLSPPLSEKATKGGSSTPLAKTYAYQLCWGANASQVEVEPYAWTRASALAHGQKPPTPPPGYTEPGAVQVGAGGQQRQLPPRPTQYGGPVHLGMFRGFIHIDNVTRHMDAGTPHAPRVGKAPLRPVADAVSLVPADPEHLGRTVGLYDAPDDCVSGEVHSKRRVYVFHVCSNMDVKAWAASETALCRSKRQKAVYQRPGAPVCAGLPERVLPATGEWNAANEEELRSASEAKLTARQLATSSRSSTARILHVEEDGLCTYKMYLGTDLACDTFLGVDIRAAMKNIPEHSPSTTPSPVDAEATQ